MFPEDSVKRPSGNTLMTSPPIEVANLKVGSFEPFVPGAAYYPAPGNPKFLAAYIGNKRTGHPMKGWKLHVSAFPYNAQQVADNVLPVLDKMRIWHKYVVSSMVLNEMTEGQRGKFITIYTDDTEKSQPGEQSVSPDFSRAIGKRPSFMA